MDKAWEPSNSVLTTRSIGDTRLSAELNDSVLNAQDVPNTPLSNTT
jgi:hypothetical protein